MLATSRASDWRAVGHRAAEADHEIQFPQLLRLLGAAGKAVHHAAQATHRLDARDDLLGGAARMHDQRQVEALGQLQLSIEIVALRLCIQSVDEKVQAAFADRAGPLAFDPLGKLLQVRRAVLLQKQRMQAVSWVEARRLIADRTQARPTGSGDCRHHLLYDARGLCARDHRRAVVVELACIQMAVAVDQPHQSRRTGAGTGALRVFQLASSSVVRPNSNSSRNGIGSGITTSIRNSAAASLNKVGYRNVLAQSSARAVKGFRMRMLRLLEIHEVTAS